MWSGACTRQSSSRSTPIYSEAVGQQANVVQRRAVRMAVQGRTGHACCATGFRAGGERSRRGRAHALMHAHSVRVRDDSASSSQCIHCVWQTKTQQHTLLHSAPGRQAGRRASMDAIRASQLDFILASQQHNPQWCNNRPPVLLYNIYGAPPTTQAIGHTGMERHMSSTQQASLSPCKDTHTHTKR